MDGDRRDDAPISAMLAEAPGGEERNRLAARAYRPRRIEIEEALRHNWLEIWYQPKIDLRRKSLVGAEALARIRHPELGILLPKSFLPEITEESAAHLTEHVLLAALRHWPVFEATGCNPRLAINVPLKALERLPIAAQVAHHRPQATHWPGLIVEVKEGEAVRDLDLALKLAAELRARGIVVSIDNFGARCASFARLREAAFAELKIARGFVKNCAIDAANAAVCQSVIVLAHRLGSVVVAEGIESGADLQALQSMRCDLGQGVLIAPPMPMAAFVELLQRQSGKSFLPQAPSDTHPLQAGRPRNLDRIA